MDKKKEKIIIWLIVIVSILRILSVFTISNNDLIYDEATHMNIARGLLEGIDYGYMNGEYSEAQRPPLQPLILIPFFALFGISEFVARSVSAIFGVLSIVVVYFLGKRLYNREVGLYSSFILAVNPMHWFYSSKALVEGILIFFIILFLYVFYSSFKDKRYLVPAGFLLSIIFLTKYTGGAVAIFFILFILIWKRDLLKSRYFYLSIIVALLTITPWISFNLRIFGEPFGGANFLFAKGVEVSEANLLLNFYSFYIFDAVIMAALFLPFMLGGFYFMFRDKDKNFFPFILFFLLFIIPISVMAVKRARYLLPVLPVLTVATAYCFMKLKTLKISGIKFEKYLIPLVIVLVVGSGIITVYGFDNYPRSHRFKSVPEAGKYLQENCMDKKIYSNSYTYVWWYTHKEGYDLGDVDFQEKNVCVFYDFFYASNEFEYDLDTHFETVIDKGGLKVYKN
ncbi:MAG: phospholipid carrier-dependent glycosyltransferase [Candidatus Aenigmarchaeota archaeon]|nr:phospholipid carrier-dependent glycosyltransferase [Candidatus Aenigmarchaeota archaeon]